MNNFQIRSIFQILMFAAGATLLASCAREYETVFSESADARLQKALTAYNDKLKSAPYGWKAALYTPTGAGYFYYLDFNDEGVVTMVSDFNVGSASTPMATSWTIKAFQQPTLSFDEYSYIHLPADPDGGVNGGNNGEGLLSDFEFIFVKTTDDSVVMKGLKHDTEMVFVQATQAEADDILNAQIKTVLQETLDYVVANKGLRLRLPDDTEVPIAIDVAHKLVGTQHLSASREIIETVTTAFTFSLTGIHLKNSFLLGGFTIADLVWDGADGVYRVQLDKPTDLYDDESPLFFYPGKTLYSVFEKDYAGIVIPENPGVNRLPGQSDAFVQAYEQASQELLTGIYAVTLHDMGLGVDLANQVVLFDVIIGRTSASGVESRYLARYAFTYTLDADGVLDLTPDSANENGSLISFEMRTMLQHLEEDTFKLEYIAGGFQLIGGFYSQDDPDFYFSGYLNPRQL